MPGTCAKISDSELAVMKVLWAAKAPLPLAALREELAETRGWDASTTKTLLRRLCSKGAAAPEKREVYYYRPLVSEAEYAEAAAGSLLDRVFHGSAASLVASLVRANRISDDDLEALRRFLDAKKGT